MSMSVNFEYTPAGIDDAIQTLLKMRNGLGVVEVEKWFSHLGAASAEFWAAAASWFRSHQTMTLNELSAFSGIPESSLRARLMNSSKAIKDEKVPDPMPGDWDATKGCTVYTMSWWIRDDILKAYVSQYHQPNAMPPTTVLANAYPIAFAKALKDYIEMNQ